MQKHLIPFHQDQIIAFSSNGDKLIAIKPICEAFQIDWSAQFRKVQRDSLLNSVIAVMATTGSDGKNYQMVCLPLGIFPMWLAKIDSSRIKNELAKEKIILYQKEAAKVLYEYFIIGSKPNKKVELDTESYIQLLEEHIELLKLTKREKRRRKLYPKFTPEDRIKMLSMHNGGISIVQIAKELDKSTATVHYELKIAGIK